MAATLPRLMIETTFRAISEKAVTLLERPWAVLIALQSGLRRTARWHPGLRQFEIACAAMEPFG